MAHIQFIGMIIIIGKYTQVRFVSDNRIKPSFWGFYEQVYFFQKIYNFTKKNVTFGKFIRIISITKAIIIHIQF